ncbi:hypothetical protein PR202_ga25376 [Eleusine coracana subsp. coracana]|uniref:Uncharacterized protein n=1 Tax=Eleusine coracana subsp. coracana TaxID=191504 RepID=A0AAV5DB63_ELECO|nr:hypothetical protein PR202_ga25376 [Eleusine coracana subsp. coracana]
MLFHYDGTLEQWNDLDWSGRAVHVAAQGQTKWWFAKRFLHPDVVAEYEFIFLWDEDIEVDNFDPLRYLDVVKREGLEVSQPALDRRSEMHHAITARALMPASDVHRRAQGVRCENDNMGPPCMGWVEVMVPVFSQEAWRCVWHMVQNDLVHGWGLDFKVGYCAQGDRKQNVAVIDSEYVPSPRTTDSKLYMIDHKMCHRQAMSVSSVSQQAAPEGNCFWIVQEQMLQCFSDWAMREGTRVPPAALKVKSIYPQSVFVENPNEVATAWSVTLPIQVCKRVRLMTMKA